MLRYQLKKTEKLNKDGQRAVQATGVCERKRQTNCKFCCICEESQLTAESGVCNEVGGHQFDGTLGGT